jgi:hypothetical protein
MLVTHFATPDIHPFYDVREKMKHGGKKSKSQAGRKKKYTNYNKNVIHINIGKGKSRYEQMNHTTRLQKQARPMANPPSVSLSTSYAVPNPIAFPARSVEYGQNDIPNPRHERVEARNNGVPIYPDVNPAGIQAVSSNARRAVSTKVKQAGGVFSQSPEAIRVDEHDYKAEAEDYKNDRVSYFAPTGRNNTHEDHRPAVQVAAQPADYFPNQGQAAIPLNSEIQRLGRARAREESIDRVIREPTIPPPIQRLSRARAREESIDRVIREPTIPPVQRVESSTSPRHRGRPRGSERTLFPSPGLPRLKYGGVF